MPGTLIPPWYHHDKPSCDDLVVVSVIWGLSLGLSIFGIIRCGNQTYHQWKRKRGATTYMIFIWLEVIASTILGGLGWSYIYGTIPPSFEIFFLITLLWVAQIHCIMQIIINRIALISVSRSTVRRLRWGVFAFLIIINISVGIVWISAQLQLSKKWIHTNEIYDRTEKAVFAVLDAGLNFYFIYLVRSSLIQYGLTKYALLYWFNLAMIALSITTDILIIGTMSFRNSFLFVIFHPLAYLVKLHVELSMADLIAKIVKSSGNPFRCDCTCHRPSSYPLFNTISDHTALSSLDRVAQLPDRGRPRLSRRRPQGIRNPSAIELTRECECE
ncbi:hypothetical protein EDB81DRAFT_699057 [Dactylonectria macrodidyma]|uniref:Uncharacterized protein n=1 Tax=Dactylonectria macrodidyma TaxID=307937 RepID=A0A9P9ILD6_9HYPO|nr:hypothetical protein EDB81DRAFT_699057 [Dactylonectria macrodidyma]